MLAASRLDQQIAREVVDFATAVRPRLSGEGDPEAQLYGPLENMFDHVVRLLGLEPVVYPQTRLPPYGVKPDFGLQVGGSVVGYVEVKRPGRGADASSWPRGSHDYRQWDKLRLLPNVLYTDGDEWILYRGGARVGGVRYKLITERRAKLPPPDALSDLSRVLQEFVLWRPEPPRTIEQLVRSISGLCRLLRDEVLEALRLEESGASPRSFTPLVEDWRRFLFPDCSEEEFADGYAQTITFALLLARVEDLDFESSNIHEIAVRLGRRHSLMGRALGILVDGLVTGYEVAVNTLVRVIAAVDWERLEQTNPNAWQHLYEPFLSGYDAALRRKTGSYYTPQDVATFMVNFSDEVLRTRLGLRLGFASPEVVVVDPAMGTGTFLAAIMDQVKQTIAREEGEGAVPGQLRSLARRLIGLEKQIGPFAVAEWRIHSALRELGALEPKEGVRLHVSDTLERPDEGLLPFPTWYEPIARSKREADRVKLEERVLVVIGNPPYGERAKGQGRWIEIGHPKSGSSAPLDAFREPGNGRHEHKLSNLYVYFWRWGTWKVFDAHADSPSGIVAFISTAGYLSGPGFAGMRRYLRQRADEGWIIDLSPEGHRPDVSSRVFPDVQRELCIGVFCRRREPNEARPAQVRYLAVEGTRAEKFRRLGTIALDDAGWIDCSTGWCDPFRSGSGSNWERCPLLGDLLSWSVPGVKPNRTWVYAPDPATLRSRWTRLVAASREEKRNLLKENPDRTIDSQVRSVRGMESQRPPLALETRLDVEIEPVAYRSFDRQWVILDNRVIDRVRPELWISHGPKQVYISELHTSQLTSGPGVTFSAHIPDMHHYNGRGGRVLPLFRDSTGTRPNLAPGLLSHVSARLGFEVAPDDLLAYVAALVAHSGYTRHFREELKVPGVRVPLSGSPDLWLEALDLGREVIWLHTYGERYADPELERPPGPPRLAIEVRPRVRVGIPLTPEDMPDDIHYEEATQTLHVGLGQVRPVSEDVWNYEVCGMRIVRKWFGYRKKHPEVKISSALNDIRPRNWEAKMTTELLNLLTMLSRLVALEQTQADLLARVEAGPLITTAELEEAKVLPVAPAAKKAPRRSRTATPGQTTLALDHE